MKRNFKNKKGPKGGATSRPSFGSGQRIATSTPGSSTRKSTLATPELPLSPPPEIRDNAGSSSSSSVPPPALAVVPPTSRATDVANSSLVQRVPRSFCQIAGRRPIYSYSANGARSSKKYTKEEVPKLKAKDAISMQPSTSAEAARNQSEVAKSSQECPKEEVPKPKANDSNDFKQEASNTGQSRKRKNIPEARDNADVAPSQPIKQKYNPFMGAMSNQPIGFVILNWDQVQQQVSSMGTFNPGQGNPSENMEPMSTGIGEVNDHDPPSAENPDTTTGSLPGKDHPKTKKCLIM